ncbi:MAG: hypothetical protein K5668_08195 [Lachnospiraceae bacterium]|nr:hypothetical protein [Lachnospiraceae bacterium]
MNSAKTKLKLRFLTVFFVFFFAFNLTACDVDTLPEYLAGKVIKAILERDYDLIYNTGDESAEIPDYTQPSWESPEMPEESQESPEPSEVQEEEPETEEESSEAEETEDDTEVEEDDKAYYFSTLDSSEKKLYLEIYNSIFAMEDNVALSTKDPDEVDRIFNLCMMDHPELFFCDGYKAVMKKQGEETTGIDFTGKYNTPKEERKEKQEKIEAAAEKVLSDVPTDDSDYEKVKYIYEWIIDNTEYDETSEDNQNIASVFLNHKSVCQGYTMATKYLLDRMGIFCTVVYGTAADENHAWNLVKMDGTYCYVDTTWGDSSYSAIDHSENSRTSYNYFGCNNDILTRTHTISERGELPECSSLDEYYYVKESKYFTKMDEERLKAVFDHEKAAGSHSFTIRASSEEVYDELFDVLFTQQKIFELIPDAEKITYIEDKSELTLTFTV